MSNVIPIPVRLSQRHCGECESDLFILAEKEKNVIFAVCYECNTSLVPINCMCSLGIEDGNIIYIDSKKDK